MFRWKLKEIKSNKNKINHRSKNPKWMTDSWLDFFRAADLSSEDLLDSVSLKYTKKSSETIATE